jgi:hypothetical protein
MTPLIEKVKPTTGLLAIVDPQGNLIHTMLGLKREEIIEEFLREEQVMNLIGNVGRTLRMEPRRCAKSWEAYEAEGYRIIPVKIIPD